MSILKINSAKLGEIEYSENDVVTLCSPLLGFNELNEFLLISNESSYPFIWFQSVENNDICFILVEATKFFTDYEPTIPKREMKVLSIEDIENMKIFSIVVIPEDPTKSTANLRAPLIINLDKKIAKQIILDNDVFPIKRSLFAAT